MGHTVIPSDPLNQVGKVDHLHGLPLPQVCAHGACEAIETARLVSEAELRGELWRSSGVSLQDGLDAACRLVELVQLELRGRIGDTLSATEFRQLAGLHTMAVSIAKAAKLTPVLKQAQLRVSDGRPLAVCCGQLARNLITIEGVRVHAGPDGCGIVFADTTGLQRRMFRTCCDEDWNDCEHKQRTRTATRQFNRRLRAQRAAGL